MLSTAFWMQDDHRATTEAVGNALDSQPRQRNYCPSLFPAQWPLGRILGTTRRWLISGRFFTYKFGAHPRGPEEAQGRPGFVYDVPGRISLFQPRARARRCVASRGGIF